MDTDIDFDRKPVPALCALNGITEELAPPTKSSISSAAPEGRAAAALEDAHRRRAAHSRMRHAQLDAELMSLDDD